MGDELYTSMSHERFTEIMADISAGGGRHIDELKKVKAGTEIKDLPADQRESIRQMHSLVGLCEHGPGFIQKLTYLPWRTLRIYKDGRAEAE